MGLLTKEIGDKGESLAADYLKKKGYVIRERNYRKPWGELDIVASAPDGTLVFIEVKTVTGKDPGIKAEELITSSKLYKLVKMCSFCSREKYFSQHINEAKGWRIDAITLTIDGKDCDISHFENIA